MNPHGSTTECRRRTTPTEERLCIVCCSNDLNQSPYAVACSSCEYETCKACVREYILARPGKPQCMNCGVEFPPVFLITTAQFNIYACGEYRLKRGTELFQRCQGMFPQFLRMLAVEKRSQTFNLKREVSRGLATITKLVDYAASLTSEYVRQLPEVNGDGELDETMAVLAAFKHELGQATDAFDPAKQLELNRLADEAEQGVGGRAAAATGAPNAHRSLLGEYVEPMEDQLSLFKCVRDDCTGYICKSKPFCSACQVVYCVTCRSAIEREPSRGGRAAGGKPTYIVRSELVSTPQDEHIFRTHVCAPENLATIELLTSDTRPCPKCSTPIHKISGCDQMFCTSCKCTFCWRTMKIIRGEIHNPHYFEYLEATRGAGGQDNQTSPVAVLLHRLTGVNRYVGCDGTKVRHFLRLLLELRDDGDWFAPLNDDPVIERECFMFLDGKLSEKELKHRLFQTEKEKERRSAVTHVMEGFLETMTRDVAERRLREFESESSLRDRERFQAYLVYIVNAVHKLNMAMADIGFVFASTVTALVFDGDHDGYVWRIRHDGEDADTSDGDSDDDGGEDDDADGPNWDPLRPF